MNVLGVEFSSRKLNYVLLACEGEHVQILQSNRLELSDTRSRQALRAFQSAIAALINGTSPELIGIKDKPETGHMRAGAAALKMEGILLAAAPCDVEFISGKRINACADDDSLNAYHQPAYKAALAAFRKQSA
ncbi:DUF3010 family protein [Kaistia nematophila]|uniref:DUF3010 family protein n=1 Tax=Kaistia nematophila TaxID=2994654 RepID=A0A9X3ILH8_9HYPH|nr:DUF3010 family protein [Kaistia nematophila]MCX5570694.1 DUF3010 family protein [Kaistia nematophila]